MDIPCSEKEMDLIFRIPTVEIVHRLFVLCLTNSTTERDLQLVIKAVRFVALIPQIYLLRTVCISYYVFDLGTTVDN